MDLAEVIRFTAFAAVTIDDFDPEYQLRFIYRWYSERYHTALHEVYDLPLDFILQTFFETRYAEMDDAAREKEKLNLLETEEQKKAKLREKDKDLVQMYLIEKDDEKSRERAKTKKLADIKHEVLKPVFSRVDSQESKFPTQKKGNEIPPNIKMEFASKEAFEELLEGFGSMPLPIKPAK